MDILVMTWNAGGVKFYTSDMVKQKKKNYIPQFMTAGDMQTLLDNHSPTICIIATQGEEGPDSLFHDDFLGPIMDHHEYDLLTTDRLKKVGSNISSTGKKKEENEMISTSIYIKKDMFEAFDKNGLELNELKTSYKKFYFTQKIGDRKCAALTSYFRHDVFGTFAFTNVHLPTGTERLDLKKSRSSQPYDRFRERIITGNRNFLNMVLQGSIEEFPLSIDHHLMAGDFGSVLNPSLNGTDITNRQLVEEIVDDLSAANFKRFMPLDELKDMISTDYKEGISNEGPLFAPTWSLTRGREKKCRVFTQKIDISCFNEIDEYSNVGWPDRVLFKEFQKNAYIAHCVSYRRIDLGIMKDSNHAGVLGYFELRYANSH